MGQFLSHIYAVLMRPQTALAHVAQRHYWWQAALILLLVITMNTLSYAKAMHLGLSEMLLSLFVAYGFGLLFWTGAALVFSLCADLFGGQGRIVDTMTALGFAGAPFLFLPVVHAFPNILGQAGHTLKLLAVLALGFWVLSLMIIGLKHAQSLSLDRSIGSLIIGGVIVVAGLLGSVTLLSIQATLLLKQFS